MYETIVIGGGAAGFFSALSAKKVRPSGKVAILEKSGSVLSKVRISGGGRCNVTHHLFDPLAFSKNYPRGGKELIGLFHRFGPAETVEWFESRGVRLKAEGDRRMFPTTDSSETIITALTEEARKLEVEIHLRQKIISVEKTDQGFLISGSMATKNLILASGSSSEGHEIAKSFGHTIVPAVPSLFTFNVPNSSLKELSGIAITDVKVAIEGFPLIQRGPLLITHFGFSGPAVLKLSAWGARFLHGENYRAKIVIDWLPAYTQEKVYQTLLEYKKLHPKKNLASDNPFHLPKNFWKVVVPEEKAIKDVSDRDLQILSQRLHHDPYLMEGKTTHKEEFVTCGGIELKEVNFKKMESKLIPGLFFAGEILDIDGVTGGFNFQNAWTTGYIAGTSDGSLHLQR
jgi:predicted Rossmann fold flavoprotein